MKAEEILNKHTGWTRERSGEVNISDVLEAMEDYHQSRLKEIMPTDEEIDKEFPFKKASRNFIPSESYNRMQKHKNTGAKWFKSEIEKRNK